MMVETRDARAARKRAKATVRGETKLQWQLISLRVGHESPFKVKTKLKQAASAAWWWDLTRPDQKLRKEDRRGVAETSESQLFTELFRVLTYRGGEEY